MADLLLAGTGTTLYRPDALDGFSATGSAESTATLRFRSKMFSVGAPAGERIFRRLYVTVIHSAGCGFWVTPVVDGRLLSELRTWCSRPAPTQSDEERYVFMIPMWQTSVAMPAVKTGVRGSVVGIEVDVTAPDSRFHIETVEFGVNLRNEARGRRTSE